jgi:transcriptional regulator with XRE-family HTH domain
MKIDRATPTPAALAELARRLSELRRQQGLSQADLAQAAGLGIATLRRIEDGKDAKLGSWLRLLVALQREEAIEQLLPEEFLSPLAEVRATGRRRRPRARTSTTAAAAARAGFVWGDERR